MSKEKRNNTLTPTLTDTRDNTIQLKAQQTNRQKKTKIERQIEQLGKLKLEIEEVSRLSQIEIRMRLSISDTIEDKREKIEELKGYQKAIYRAKKLENNMAHKQRIEKNIQKRFNNFANNTKKMIDSILSRHKTPVIINKIAYKGYNTTEPKEIKCKIKEHFRQWTKHNPKDKTYEGVEDEISINKLNAIIEEAPKGKAIGPSKVSNEIIKRLGNKAIKTKKEELSGDLNETRPITLLEHVRKILMKITDCNNNAHARRCSKQRAENKYIMSDGAKQSNIASRSRRIAGSREKLHNSLYTNSSNRKKKNEDRNNYSKERKLE
ncbi:12290_t:CDS:2 [Gigaspora margarita]|uniref:12290_t:CDS:1 n=1 Tax=Gigaspora margarita TaxID=4874 RepID=A0ABN7V3M5_GIGMA|nr:12290_t:CDS:2 [Gigaspora margarita]